MCTSRPLSELETWVVLDSNPIFLSATLDDPITVLEQPFFDYDTWKHLFISYLTVLETNFPYKIGPKCTFQFDIGSSA